MSEPEQATNLGQRRPAEFCALAALAAALATLLFFTPRFDLWSGIDYPELPAAPEFGRARWALVQISDLHAPIADKHHTVIAWRLLFPIVWHYLQLPRWLFLAMPAVGCVAALWLVTWLSYRRCGDWLTTLLATSIFAALPWFFVSSGWLAYFDSWLVLGLLVAAFVESRTVLALTCLLVPWIDERFLLGLPVVFAARVIHFRRVEDRAWRAAAVDAAVIVLASLLYPTVSAAVWVWGDAQSSAYVTRHAQQAQGVPWQEYAHGLWSSYRAAWVLLVAAVPLVWRRAGWLAGACVALVLCATAAFGLAIAADMTRTLTVLCPLLLVGTWLWEDWRPASLRWILGAILLANLALPAGHVMWGLTIPIRGLPTAIARLNDPQPQFVVARLLREGNAALGRHEFGRARDMFTAVLELDKNSAFARLQRAVASSALGDVAEAGADLDALLQAQPGSPDVLLMRASVRHARGDSAGAAEDLAEALRNAPPNWPLAPKARESLEKISPGASPKGTSGVP